MESLYTEINADNFFRKEFGSNYYEYITKISHEFSKYGNGIGFHKYRNYAIVGPSTVCYYYKYINWLNKNLLPINCINVIW